MINRSKINLANIARVDLLINSRPHEFECDSEQATTSLRATELSGRVLSRFSPEELKTIQRAALRITFFSETGSEKNLDITALRTGDERHRFQRVQLLKNAIWWAAFLGIASRQAGICAPAWKRAPQSRNRTWRPWLQPLPAFHAGVAAALRGKMHRCGGTPGAVLPYCAGRVSARGQPFFLKKIYLLFQ